MAKRSLYKIVGLLLLALLPAGCTDSNNPVGPDPHAPIFIATAPDRGTADVPMFVSLSWSCEDPDGDALTFDVYLGASPRALKVAAGITDTFFTSGLLEADRLYFWYVVATDSTGRASRSGRQSFTTVPSPIYPLSVGSRWAYDGIWFADNFDMDSIPPSMLDTTLFTSVVEAVSFDTLLDTLEVYRLHEVITVGISTVATDQYFNFVGHGLYRFAATNANARMSPVKVNPAAGTVLFGGRCFAGVGEIFSLLKDPPATVAQWGLADDIVYDNPPLRSLQYPLEIGREWWALENEDFRIVKEVVDITDLTVPAGQFPVHAVRWHYGWLDDPLTLAPGPGGQGGTQSDEVEINIRDASIDFVDYISPLGLVRRTIHIHGITASGPSAEPLGTFDAHEDWVLTSVYIP